jgi:CTP:molybdopterin cytidylyltransferase MocA
MRSAWRTHHLLPHTSKIKAMVAKSVIILSSGRANYAAGGALDDLIKAITALGKTPVLVLGPDGDDLMRTCAAIETCELVYDPNFNGGMFSGIKAGLHAVHGPAYVIPLADPTALEFSKWNELETVLRANDVSGKTGTHVIRPVTQNGAIPLFPQLVTAHGLLPIKALPATTDWASSDRLHFETIVVAHDSPS